MKSTSFLVVKSFAVGFLLLLAAGNQGLAAEKTFELKYAHFGAESVDTAQADKWWASEVEKRTNGRVKFKYFFSQSLIKAPDMLKGISTGIADVGLVASAYSPTQLPLTSLYEQLYISMKPDAQTFVAKEMYRKIPAFRAEYTKNNVVLVNAYGIAPTIIAGKGKPIETLADLQGKKIRAVAKLGDLMGLLGGTPVALAVPELYGALERGVVDGYTAIPLVYVTALKLDEQTDWVMDPRIGIYHVSTTVMNQNTWKRLPADIQRIIEAVSAEVPAKYTEILVNLEKAAYEKLAANPKIKLFRLSEAETEKWKAKALPTIWNKVVDDVAKRAPGAREVWAQYQKLMKEYDAKSRYHWVMEERLGNK